MSEPTAPTAATACALCGTLVDPATLVLANGHSVCQSCAAQLAAEISAGAVKPEGLPLAVAGGAAGALVAAGVWSAIVVQFEMEIGYLAVLVGFLAGYGVKLGARGSHGRQLQGIAVATACAGLVAQKYLVFAYTLRSMVEGEGAQHISYVGARTLLAFLHFVPQMLSFFDLLWLFLAVSTAWRVPAAPEVRLRS